MIQFQLRSRFARGPQAPNGSQTLGGSQTLVGPQALHRWLVGCLLVFGLLIVSAGVQAEAGPDAAPVDLNRASAEQLSGLPGIGAAKAAAIVAHRAASGAFQSVDDLEAVRGIGPALVAKLRPLVTLGSQVGSKSRSKAAAPNRSAAAK